MIFLRANIHQTHKIVNSDKLWNSSGYTVYSNCLLMTSVLEVTFQLAKGMTKQEGIVEVFFNGIRGCMDLHESNLPGFKNVTLRMLGLLTTHCFFIRHDVSSSMEDVHYDDKLQLSHVYCNGNESSIRDCSLSITENKLFLIGAAIVSRYNLVCGKGTYISDWQSKKT